MKGLRDLTVNDPGMAGRKTTAEALLLFFALLCYTAVVLWNAWVTDDAYITLRTVDNFVNGLGLTWNSGERVQVYTHPLWMFLLSGLYFFTREAFYTSIFFSAAVSLAAVSIFAFKLARSSSIALVSIVVLTFSKAFIDFSTSGLENPLTHLILALFFLVYFGFDNNSSKRLFLLSFLASLGILNRLDTALFFLPPLAFFYFSYLRLVGRKAGLYGTLLVVAGFLPMVFWELFSLLYYGFPFPNTAYAKLNTGINGIALAQQGLNYLYHSLYMDPLTLSTIAFILLALVLKREWQTLPAAAGILLYLLYVVKVGGDFMTGRFLTAALFAAVIILSQFEFDTIKFKRACYLAIPLIVMVGLSSPFPPLLTGADYGKNPFDAIYRYGIADERQFYFQAAGLIKADRNIQMPHHVWALEGKDAGQGGEKVMVRTTIGYYGYFAGPDVYVIDRLALSDPLLARLPAKPGWRIGHFERPIPEGYVDTIASGENKIENPAIAKYYEDLKLVTRGPLLNKDRLRLIWKLNLGK